MSVSSLQARIRDGVRSAGRRLSANGLPLSGQVTRVTGANETTYPPTPGSEKDYHFSGLVFRYSLDDMRGTDITARDVRVMVTVPLRAADGSTTEPSNGDTLTIAGQRYHIVDVMREGPGGAPLFWYCQCRSGD